ncbi:MAG: hypothetical protein GY810_14755 [Aureispira sp.]|nr:hypothetical protein [Aureispira sp.]
MFKITYYTLILSILISLNIACDNPSNDGGDDSPVGVWKLEAPAGHSVSEREASTTVEFKTDGTLIRKRNDSEHKGQWKIKEKDGKKFLVITGDNTGGRDPQEHEIKQLDGSTFIFLDKPGPVTLKKM